MKGFGKPVRDKLEEAGCWFVRYGKGRSRYLVQSDEPATLTVPVNIMSRHLANKILRDAGLPKAF